MSKIPAAYAWLADLEGIPRTIAEGVKLLGTIETPGGGNTAAILAWADEVGGNIDDVYKADSIPWCGLFAAVVAKRAGKTFPGNALWALSWSAFGVPVDKPGLGDVLVFKREGGGHVGFYVAEDAKAFHVLGGNQGDAVSITRILKARLYAARRPAYTVKPAAVRSYVVKTGGALSTNEA